MAPLDGVGRDYPLSIEKLCPVLSFYVVKDWREGCERCKQILRYGGMGHTMSIHSQNDQVILEFGLKKPAFRIVVNTPTTHGSIGLTTGLDPAMTLGCGGYGGNITSDNISPRHLLNIKRLAYEITPAVNRFEPAPGSAAAARRCAGVPRRRPASARRRLAPDRRVPRLPWFRGHHAGRPGEPRPPPGAVLTPDRDPPDAKPAAARFRLRRGRAAGDSGGPESWSSPSAPSSRRRRATSASSTACFRVGALACLLQCYASTE